jgi:ParB family chromosome partitioning protein
VRAGAFVTLGHEGAVRIERGFVRPEDMPVVEPSTVVEADDESPGEAPDSEGEAIGSEETETDDKPLSDRLVEELTLHRTAALQDRLADRPDVALAAVVHALALRTFYGVGVNPHTCLKIEAGPVAFGNGVGEGPAARAVAARHDGWAGKLPKKDAELWAWLIAQDDPTRLSLLAYCAARTVNAVRAPWVHEPKRLAQTDTLAQAVGLDMVDYWAPTVDLYLGRVTKARIIEAVRDGVSERDADSIADLKKADMASHAERLLAGKRWLPSLLRTPAPAAAAHSECAEAEAIDRAAE